MIQKQNGTILIIFVGLLSVFIASTICVININSVVSQQQYLRNVVDQATLIGVNQIDLNHYYNYGISRELILDAPEVKKAVSNYIYKSYLNSEILHLDISTNSGEVEVYLEKRSKLPFDLGINFVKISALARAKLQAK
ncbi:MAG: hypothetical protein RIS18_569 [Actinomycetota bacterium]|jgi:hypothetical protein